MSELRKSGINLPEREQVEEDLKRSELRYRTLFEQASDAILITDENGHLIEVNKSFCKMVGYIEKELIGMNITTLMEPEHLKKDPLRFDLLLEDKALFRERLMKKKDGTVFQIEENVKMLGDKRIFAIIRDITERKEAEGELRRSDDSIRLIIDTIPTMAWSLGPNGIVDFLNQRWMDYTGLSLKQFIEDPARPIHPEDLPRVLARWRKEMTVGEQYDDEMRLQRADGEYRWFLVRTAPLHDEHGKLIKWYGVSIDIEDSKRAEDLLRESEQQFLSLFENMAEGVAYFQMLFKDGKLQDAIYLEVNPAWENLTGLRNVIGRKITEVLPGILETDSEFIQRSVRVALTGQPERFEAYSDLLKKWLSTSAYCPKKEHVIVVLDDITERKLAEETLKQSYEEIRRLTEHLQKIREEERTSIAREIHDELGQQLTAIKMDVAWIDKKTPEETTDIKIKLKNIITLLDGSNQSIRRILSELRSRIFDDHGLLEAVEWLGRQFTEATGIPVKLTTPEKDIKVPEQIATCIFRVCQEAFTNITRHALAKNVSISINISEENIVAIVEDDGIGFDTTCGQNKKSFGILGMKERVLSLGGKFDLVSSPRKGTKITVSLPYRV
jgi:PAS domain S-box-containing protein